MAAPQWSGGKCKSVQQVKAWFRHNDLESRMEMHHTNPDINKELTPYNFTYRGLDYDGMCQAFDALMDAVDVGRESKGHNARVVLQSVLVYLPKGLADAEMDVKRKWFTRAGDILDEQFGSRLIDMQVDMDEVHEYTDPDTGEKVMSREHGHARLFPEVDGKLNGKAFTTRKAITQLNNALQAMSVKEFGCPMMDGTKRKGRKTVEDLKVRSEAAEILAQAEREAQETRQRAQEARQEAEEEARAIREKARQDAQAEADGLLQEISGLVGKLRKIDDSVMKRIERKTIEEAAASLQKRQGRVSAAESISITPEKRVLTPEEEDALFL